MLPTLVVFGEDWGGHPSSTQHLVRHLSADRVVIWVNSIGLRRPRLSAHDLQRAARKLVVAAYSAVAGDRSAVREGVPGATPFPVLAPLVVPAVAQPALRRLNRCLLGSAVRAAMRSRDLRDPILWISLPTATDVVGSLGERAVVYYCGDDWAALAGVDHAVVCRFEAELQERANLILAASPALAARFPPDKTVLVPHGVDVAQFSTRQPRAADFPRQGPVAGFFGSLSEWINLPLLVHAARSLPDWRFLLIGPVRNDVSALRSLPNVTLAGPRRHDELPGYLQYWDVSLLPFRDTAQIRACNPLKLREYMAGGAPIVATEFPALDGYRDLLETARTSDEFVAAIRRSAAEGGRRAAQRRARVADETWEARARQVSTLLAAL